MNSSILRAVLALALLLGVGVIANIFGVGLNANNGGMVATPSAPTLVERNRTAATRDAGAARRELHRSVRGHLVSRGYLAAESGNNASPVTMRAAILAFEFDHNLPLTARPGEPLLKALIFTHAKAATARKTVPETNEALALVAEVQRALAHLGYAETGTAAKMDTSTRKAIRKFERARGLEESGRISVPLIESFGPAFNVERAMGVPGKVAATAR